MTIYLLNAILLIHNFQLSLHDKCVKSFNDCKMYTTEYFNAIAFEYLVHVTPKSISNLILCLSTEFI